MSFIGGGIQPPCTLCYVPVHIRDGVAVRIEIQLTNEGLDHQIYRVEEDTIVHESYNAYTEQSRTALDPAPSCGRKTDTEATQ